MCLVFPFYELKNETPVAQDVEWVGGLIPVSSSLCVNNNSEEDAALNRP